MTVANPPVFDDFMTQVLTMAPFKFRLEQVRLYRKQLEEQAMQALAQATIQRDAVAKRIEGLKTAIIEQTKRLSHPECLEPGDLWITGSYAKALKQDLTHALRELQHAEDLIAQRRMELIERAKERGLLDSLKEKQAARHLQMERSQEQRTNDETATLRYKPAAV